MLDFMTYIYISTVTCFFQPASFFLKHVDVLVLKYDLLDIIGCSMSSDTACLFHIELEYSMLQIYDTLKIQHALETILVRNFTSVARVEKDKLNVLVACLIGNTVFKDVCMSLL